MKAVTWKMGALALTVGLVPSTSKIVFAQENPAPDAETSTVAKAAPNNATAAAAATPPTLIVWGGQTNNSKVGAWGNGTVEVSRGRGGNTLQVKTLNLEEGARFDLAKPIDLTPYKDTGFWQIKYQASGNTQRGGRGRNTGGSNEVKPLTLLRLKLELDQGVMSGVIPVNQASRGGRGGWGGRGGSQNLLLPVRRFTWTKGARGAVRRIILTGDNEASFNVEQFALVAETNRIAATVRRSTDPEGTDLTTITVKPGRSTTLIADVNGGTSDINVAWNFNAENSPAFPPGGTGRGGWGGRGEAERGATGRGGRAPGMAMGGQMAAQAGRPMGGAVGGAAGTAGSGQATPGQGNATPAFRRVDAQGLTARPDWPNEEQDYRVEVTITDRARRKPPVTKSILVQVRAGN